MLDFLCERGRSPGDGGEGGCRCGWRGSPGTASLTGTAWPPGTDIRALLARSEAQSGGVFVFTHGGMMWQPNW